MNSSEPTVQSTETAILDDGHVRVNGATRMRAAELQMRYGLSQTELVETAVSLFDDHCLRRSFVQLPLLTHQVVSLGHRVQLLSAQLQNLEQVADIITVASAGQGKLE